MGNSKDDSGAGGSTVGRMVFDIAVAATKAAVLHEGHGWESAGDTTVRNLFGLTVDIYSGRCERPAPVGDGAVDGSEDAERIIGLREEWHGRIEDLFSRWRGLPSGYFDRGALDRAAAEINVSPEQAESVGDHAVPINTRLDADLSTIRSRTSQLQGHYAALFADYYANPLPTTVQSLAQLISSVTVAGETQSQIWRRAAHDLADFEPKALAAMRASEPAPEVDTGSSGLTVGLTVLGAVAGALSAVATAGGSAFLLASIGGAAGVGALYSSSGPPEQPTEQEEVPLGAADPDGVFDNMRTWLDRLDAAIAGEEQKCREFVRAAHTFATSGACDLARPGLIGAAPQRVLSPTLDLDVSPDIIARLSELLLPSVAGDLVQASRGLTLSVDDGFVRSGDVGLAPVGCWPETDVLQQCTLELLARTSRQLIEAADALERAARTIGKTDDAISDRYRLLEREVEVRNINDVDGVARRLTR